SSFSFLSLYHSLHLPYLLSFPTRRSSDLRLSVKVRAITSRCCSGVRELKRTAYPDTRMVSCGYFSGCLTASSRVSRRRTLTFRRSEEHTSELQSRFDLVCRLLLEKKKQQR